MTLKSDDERRHAQRFELPKKAPATFGGFNAVIVEVSLIGCSIQHTDRITPKAHLPLRFKWRGQPVKIEATVMRSEMRSIGGRPAYVSGLSFCEKAEDSPKIVRDIVGWLAEAGKTEAGESPAAASPPPSPPATPPIAEAAGDLPFIREEDEVQEVEEAEDVDVISAPYLQCTLSGGKWDTIYVDEPAQPAEGFTILAPSQDAEVTVLCRAYQSANPAKRREMRAKFERAIAQSLRQG